MAKLQPDERQLSWATRWFLRFLLLLLVLHTLIFAYVWFNGFEASMRLGELAGNINSQTYPYLIGFVRSALAWVPIFLAHVFIHLLVVGRIKRPLGERRIYREGFRDGAAFERELLDEALHREAMRRAKRAPSDVEDSRLMLAYDDDDDGELVDLETATKRKRR